MKRRNFLKGVLSVPVVAGIRTDTSVLKARSPKPSEVEKTKDCPVEEDLIASPSVSPSGTISISASPSASCKSSFS